MTIEPAEPQRPRFKRSLSFAGLDSKRPHGARRRDMRPRTLVALHVEPDCSVPIGPASAPGADRLIQATPALTARCRTLEHAEAHVARLVDRSYVQDHFTSGVDRAPRVKLARGKQTDHGVGPVGYGQLDGPGRLAARSICTARLRGTSGPDILLFLPSSLPAKGPNRPQPRRQLAHILYGPFTLVALAETYCRYPQRKNESPALPSAWEPLEPFTKEVRQRLHDDLLGSVLADCRAAPFAVIECLQETHVLRPLAYGTLADCQREGVLARLTPALRGRLAKLILDAGQQALTRLHSFGFHHGQVTPKHMLLDMEPRFEPLSAGRESILMSRPRLELANCGSMFREQERPPALNWHWASPAALAHHLRLVGGTPDWFANDLYQLARVAMMPTARPFLPFAPGMGASLPCGSPPDLLAAALGAEGRPHSADRLRMGLSAHREGLLLAIAESRAARSRLALFAPPPSPHDSVGSRMEVATRERNEIWRRLEWGSAQLQQLAGRYSDQLRSELGEHEAMPHASTIEHLLTWGVTNARPEGARWPEEPGAGGMAPGAGDMAAELQDDERRLELDSISAIICRHGLFSPYFELFVEQNAAGRLACERDLYPSQRHYARFPAWRRPAHG